MRSYFSCLLIILLCCHLPWQKAQAEEPNALQVYYDDIQSSPIFRGHLKDNTEIPDSFFKGADGLQYGGEIALIIIGLVIYASWAIYFPWLLANVLVNHKVTKNFQMINLSPSFIFEEEPGEDDIHGPTTVAERRKGTFSGITYNLYVRKKGSRGIKAHMGLAAEAGYFYFKDQYKFLTLTHSYSGFYGMVGPSFLLTNLTKGSEDPHTVFGTLDLMFGASDKKAVGLLAKAQLFFNFITENNYIFGIGLGGLHADADATEGTVSNLNEVSLIGTLRIGKAF